MSSCATSTRRSASSTSRSSCRRTSARFDFLMPWEGAEYVLPGDEKAKRAGARRADGAGGRSRRVIARSLRAEDAAMPTPVDGALGTTPKATQARRAACEGQGKPAQARDRRRRRAKVSARPVAAKACGIERLQLTSRKLRTTRIHRSTTMQPRPDDVLTGAARRLHARTAGDDDDPAITRSISARSIRPRTACCA